jgi:hypothetical protein
MVIKQRAQLDEDYFVHTLMPFAPPIYAGRAIYKEALELPAPPRDAATT